MTRHDRAFLEPKTIRKKYKMHYIYKYTSFNISLSFKNTDILPMSSRKRMNLKKTRLANHRKLYSRDLPVCKSKNKFSKTIPIQKEHKYRYTYKNKKHG